ncbi:SusC/RagA family TonB-linked outer membrane protein [Desertivirga brevis]|uniref:SusC/RagA family TonB-linked outer membrane protein n=1 Tax=Desertivirga brevis TaxID=2810310 RepID=UPI001F6257AE|nr:TonB-dependent receptor [Pedobacter sp. SYSU D00873]
MDSKTMGGHPMRCSHLRLSGKRSLGKTLLVSSLVSAFIIAVPLQSSARKLTKAELRHVSAFPVKGTVRDERNEALPGAIVKIKGTKTSVVTDVNGAFVINASTGDVLVVSFIGYGETEVKVGAEGTAINVSLQPTDKSLNEVVVVGYGTVKKRDLTGSVASVKPDEITARPGPNPMESLQGRVAGLDITRSSGQPGEGVNLQLRGTRSISASATPLFIINGLPGDYATLNPYDIESIEVLKDASSTATYGAQGANGVIIITTKSGKAGKLSIDFNSYYGNNGWSVTPEVRTGDAYLQAKRDAYKYVWDPAANKWTTTGALWQSPNDDETIFGSARYQIFREGNFVNWAEQFLRKSAATQNYSLGVSGGNDATKGYLSFNYTDENGQYRGDQYKLYSTSMRIDHKIRKWISIGGNLQASYVDRDKAQDKLENALVTDPLVKPYKEDGTLNTDLGNNVYNLLLDYQPGVYGNVDNNTKLFLNPYLEIRPLKGLTLLSRAGAHLNYSNTYRFDGIGSVSYTYANAGIARARITQNRFQQYQWENVLTYNLKVAKDHDFTFTGVTSFFHNQNTNTEMNQSNITSNNFQWYKFTGDQNTIATSGYTMQKTFGLMGRVNYSYLGKYLFSALVRRDGSSVLYETNQWDTFPAFAAGWRISDEKFMAGTKRYLDNLKFRGSWGITGVSSIAPYTSVSIVENNNMSLGGITQPIFRNSPFVTNPNLRWERSTSTNFGIDAGFLKGRIDLALDHYITKTDGVIYSVTSPITSGYYRPGTPYQTNINIAGTKNRGLEITLNTKNIVTRNFQWSTSAAFARNRERILRLTGGVANNIANGNYTLSLGESVNSFRNFKLDGVWQIGEEADAAVFNKRPGDLKVNVPGMSRLATGVYVKEAADGTKTYYYNNLADAQPYNSGLTAANSRYSYSNNDFQILGKNNPDWSLGIQNGFKYKGIDLGVYAYFRWGQMINYNMMGWYQPNSLATNASPARTIPANFNYWTPENPTNDFPVMNYLASSSTMTGFSGLNYVDGSFFKIKNVTLGYTLPANLVKKVAMQRLRVYGTITNPLVVSKSHFLKQYDPEMNGELDYPLTKQIVVGLNVTL